MSDDATTHSCGLYLSVTATRDSSVASRLEPLLVGKDVSCLLIEPASDGAFDLDVSRRLSEAAQKHNIAVLVRDDTNIAQEIRADGVHLSWNESVVASYSSARDMLGVDAIIGADAGRSRHDAMRLGEAEAAYVAFGVPPHVKDTDKARSRQLDLIEWWSGIFEVPCVACDVREIEHARDLARCGADFVILGLPDAVSGGDLLTWINEAAGALVHSDVCDEPSA